VGRHKHIAKCSKFAEWHCTENGMPSLQGRKAKFFHINQSLATPAHRECISEL